MGALAMTLGVLAMTWGLAMKRRAFEDDALCYLSLRGTKQSLDVILMDCFAALAMTWGALAMTWGLAMKRRAFEDDAVCLVLKLVYAFSFIYYL
jgi:hypothetical protein